MAGVHDSIERVHLNTLPFRGFGPLWNSRRTNFLKFAGLARSSQERFQPAGARAHFFDAERWQETARNVFQNLCSSIPYVLVGGYICHLWFCFGKESLSFSWKILKNHWFFWCFAPTVWVGASLQNSISYFFRVSPQTCAHFFWQADRIIKKPCVFICLVAWGL